MELIIKYFPNLSQQQLDRFTQLLPLYTEWNEKINVISRKDIEYLYERHILHSLAIGSKFTIPAGARVLDIGTGGGFPGIPLSILYPDVQFTLADSIGKKIKVVQAVSDSLQLTNVKAINIRAEQLKEQFHYIISRAVCDFSSFYKLSKHLLNPQSIASFKNGIIYLKGGDLGEELKNFPNSVVYPIKDMYEEAFFESKSIVYFEKMWK